jgi:hypothetical protein
MTDWLVRCPSPQPVGADIKWWAGLNGEAGPKHNLKREEVRALWDLVFSIPIPNWTGFVLGGCVGSILTTVLIVILAFAWDREKKSKQEEEEGWIPFEEIEELYMDDEEPS